MNRPRVDRSEFLRLHHEGLSLPQLADRFNVTTRTASRLRQELGLARPSPHSSRRMDEAWRVQAGRMLDDGMPVSEVAKTLGCNEVTVARHFPGRGWDRSTIGRYAKAVKTANNELRKRGIKPV